LRKRRVFFCLQCPSGTWESVVRAGIWVAGGFWVCGNLDTPKHVNPNPSYSDRGLGPFPLSLFSLRVSPFMQIHWPMGWALFIIQYTARTRAWLYIGLLIPTVLFGRASCEPRIQCTVYYIYW